MAPGLGYQVSMDGKNYKPGDHNEVYFNLKGRKLIMRKGGHDRGDFKCFELVLPITFIMPDESAIAIGSETDYTDIKSWYNNSGVKEQPVLQYPVDMIYQDGIIKTIENDDDMKDIKINCRKWHDDKKTWNCFKLVYPVTFIIADEVTISMDNSEDWTELKTWYEENLQSEKPSLKYPAVIIYRDGTSITINDNEEMRQAEEDCLD